MVKLMQNGYFPVCSLRVDIILEGIEDFFQRVRLFGRFLFNFPYMSVGSAT